jgi:hypothetical protein
MKPNACLANEAADRFQTTNWIGVLLTAQEPGLQLMLGNLYWLDP